MNKPGKWAVSLLFFLLTICLTFQIESQARRIIWEAGKRPPISLAEALNLADAHLKNKGKYYCLRAELASTFTSADWELEYSSDENDNLSLSIGSDKSVRESKKGFNYK